MHNETNKNKHIWHTSQDAHQNQIHNESNSQNESKPSFTNTIQQDISETAGCGMNF